MSGRLARWVFKLQSYKFSISHRKGKDNIVPDVLSRIIAPAVDALEILAPEIDLNSPYFDGEEYKQLREKITQNQSKYPDVKVDDKYVYIRTEHYSGQEEQENTSWKLWIPNELYGDAIGRVHNTPTAAHGGIIKTLELLRRYLYWPGMIRDVRNYIRNCDICKSTKAPNFIMKPPMGSLVQSERPFQRMYVDLLGPYPRSKTGHIGLLIVLDHLTKFHWLYPLKKFTSSNIQEYLEHTIFHTYGVPEVIVSDNGSQFKANDINAFFTKYGIKHVYTAYYSPQSNASERVNRSLIAGIRAYLKQDHRLWDEQLSAISCALRNSCHQAINVSPYRAVFGFDMITHASSYELLRKLTLLDEPSAKVSRDDHLHIIRNGLRKHIREAHDRHARSYNLRTRPQNFTINQEVFRRNFAQSCNEKNFNAKLAPLFVRARIREKLGNHYYILEDLQGKLMGTYHGKDIRP